MSFTNHTTNKQLPQWVDDDKPSWLGDMNSAFLKVDAAFTTHESTMATMQSQILTLQTQVATLLEGI